MLQLGEELLLFSLVFVVFLCLTWSLVWTSTFTAILFAYLTIYRFPQLPSSRTRQVLHPATWDDWAAEGGKVVVIAHRAGAHDAPENTIAAIREAAKNGATAVELDVQFSSDNIPVVMHDETVDRTTNGTGCVNHMKLSELVQLDAAARHRLKEQFPREKIPTLEEAVEECIKLQLLIFFDVKGHPEQSAAAFRDLYKKYPVLYNSSVVCSFQPTAIYKMRQYDLDVVTALTHKPWDLSRLDLPVLEHYWTMMVDVLTDLAHHHVLWRFCGISAILMQKDFVSLDYVQYWSKRGVEVVAWTINNKVEKVYFEKDLAVNYLTDSLVEDCDTYY